MNMRIINKNTKKMTPEDFLQQLNPNSRVFELSIDYRYTESQLILFAKLYHLSELKRKERSDLSVSVCDFIGCKNKATNEVIVRNEYYCDKHS